MEEERPAHCEKKPGNVSSSSTSTPVVEGSVQPEEPDKKPSGHEKTGSVNAVSWIEKDQRWTGLMVGSGVTASVCPASFAPHCQVQQAQFKKSLKTASGGSLQHYGEETVAFAMGSEVRGRCTFDVLDVKRPILSVSRLTVHCKDIVNRTGGHSRGMATGTTVKLVRDQNLYFLDVDIKPRARAVCDEEIAPVADSDDSVPMADNE